MKTKNLLIALIATLPLPVFGQDITVTSGRHADFTRLVLNLPADGSWSEALENDRLEITIPKYDGGFQTDGVFQKITRNRISDVVATAGRLTVTIACECAVETFVEAGNYLVVDVIDQPGSPSTPSAFVGLDGLDVVGSVDLRFDGRGTTAPRLGATEPEPERPGIAEIAQDEERTAPIALPLLSERVERVQTPLLAPAEPDLDLGDLEDLSDLSDQIARSIGNAATRGVLDPAVRISQPPDPEPDTAAGPTIFDSSATLTEEDNVSVSNVRITSSNDVGGALSALERSISGQGDLCRAAADVDLVAWADDRPIMAQIADVRRELYGEFDRVDSKAALRLIKIYLHFGFGAEANRLLVDHHDKLPKSKFLKELAQIMEHGHVLSGSLLERRVDCENAFALWGLLAQEIPNEDGGIKPAEALKALSALPFHLRKFLAPLLSERFIALGDKENAAFALRNVERTPVPLSADGELAKAEIKLAEGDKESARELLGDVIDSNSEFSAEALVTYIETRLKDGEPISERIAELAEGYAFEFQDTELGPDLERVQILALAKTKQFDSAFDKLDGLASKMPAGFGSEIFEMFTEGADDASFLERVFDELTTPQIALSAAARRGVAKRLVQLGFGEQAQFFLGDANDTMSDGEAILRTEIAMQMNDVEGAADTISNVDQDEAIALRAKVSRATGQFDAASEYFDLLGDGPASDLSRWMTDQWSETTEYSDPLLQSTAELAATDVVDRGGLDGVLQRSEAAIAESEAARATILELLNDADVFRASQ